MLIINADDLGRNRESTDRILTCHAAGRLTSTSAMVFMEDSERAAALAQAAGIDVGLHINFSEHYSQPSVSLSVNRPHDMIIGFLRKSKYALILYNPFLTDSFRVSFRQQNDEFRRLYGCEPSHYDGHQHMHLATNMLLHGILPEKSRVRRSFTFHEGQKSWLNRAYRRAVDKRLEERHRITNFFFSLAQYMRPGQLQAIVALADTGNVELMTHPHLDVEYDYILSESFGRTVHKARLGRYDEL